MYNETELQDLNPLEDTTMRMLYNIPYNQNTLNFVGKVFNLTRERVRQIELEAMQKIKRQKRFKPALSRLADYLEDVVRSSAKRTLAKF